MQLVRVAVPMAVAVTVAVTVAVAAAVTVAVTAAVTGPRLGIALRGVELEGRQDIVHHLLHLARELRLVERLRVASGCGCGIRAYVRVGVGIGFGHGRGALLQVWVCRHSMQGSLRHIQGTHLALVATAAGRRQLLLGRVCAEVPPHEEPLESAQARLGIGQQLDLIRAEVTHLEQFGRDSVRDRREIEMWGWTSRPRSQPRVRARVRRSRLRSGRSRFALRLSGASAGVWQPALGWRTSCAVIGSVRSMARRNDSQRRAPAGWGEDRG